MHRFVSPGRGSVSGVTATTPPPEKASETGASSMRLVLSVSLPQQVSSISQARDMLAVLLSLTAADDTVRDRVAIVLTEACANVVQHGDPGATIDLHVVVEPDTCVLEVGNRSRRPPGTPLPTHPPDPAQLHGRGLPLIAALSDNAEFVPSTPGYVLLRITLRLQTHPPRARSGFLRAVE